MKRIWKKSPRGPFWYLEDYCVAKLSGNRFNVSLPGKHIAVTNGLKLAKKMVEELLETTTEQAEKQVV